MKIRRMGVLGLGTVRTSAFLVLLMFGTMSQPGMLAAHCDTMDGPVVSAAREALEAHAVELVLVWVLPPAEEEVRAAFERTRRVRKQGGEARELADLWFFETVVRLHRAGEGEPYTGLKPAGTPVSPVIARADEALERDSAHDLVSGLSTEMSSALRASFERVRERAEYDRENVAAGRRYVQAYVEFMHLVEQLHGLVTGQGQDHWSSHGEH